MRPLNMANDANLSTRRKLYPIVIMLMLALLVAKTGESRLARDHSGQTVSVPDNPLRVVSLAPSITEIVFALGEGDRLKGVTQHCDFPAEAQSLPKIGSYVHLDLERIVALKPDLCIAVRDGNPQNVVTEIEAIGIPVYTVPQGSRHRCGHCTGTGSTSERLLEGAASGKRNAHQNRTSKGARGRSRRTPTGLFPDRDRPHCLSRNEHRY